ncbi:VOC family protein [Pontibacillus yanchengensis]|uniref:VOC family protein n=2 Tax=Pontibacillus yanchengensis TaxID=462910 RepID=A0ACC7VDZ4_9BACI|nr:VOC family protein [Pontibacillus yanchengensis]MYL35395.1 VOC family protein [Pontibacillus yanchengensis]MYL52426.1 VOC family protein [Pontibacillus yanchengensis]
MKSPIENKIHTVFVHVSDLKRSVQWYSTLLGQNVNLDEVKPPVYNVPINTYTGLVLDGGPNGGKEYVGLLPHPLCNLHAPDIDEAYQFVSEKGFEINSEISRFDDIEFFTVKDPDGNVIMLCTG